jgi:hypothetical protein
LGLEEISNISYNVPKPSNKEIKAS